MKLNRTRQSASILAFLAGFVGAGIPALDLSAQERPPNVATVAASPEHALIRRMAGTWDVRASVRTRNRSYVYTRK